MMLSADQDPEANTVDVRKRFASNRRARSFFSRKAKTKLSQEMVDLTDLIEERIAVDAPDAALDVPWAQLYLAPAIQKLTDHS